MFNPRCLLFVTLGRASLGLVLGIWCAAALHGAEDAGGVKFSRRCLMINPNEGCAVGDVNNDGRPDIVSGTHWYASPDFAPRQ